MTFADIEDAMEQFAEKMDENTIAIFAFMGHGAKHTSTLCASASSFENTCTIKVQFCPACCAAAVGCDGSCGAAHATLAIACRLSDERPMGHTQGRSLGQTRILTRKYDAKTYVFQCLLFGQALPRRLSCSHDLWHSLRGPLVTRFGFYGFCQIRLLSM